MATVSLQRIEKTYGAMRVVHGIDLEVNDGEFVVLLGPSGCGKSTTLRMVAGLEEISGGTLKIGERTVNDVAAKDRGVAMVFQSYALYPHKTVEQNMAFSLKLAGKPKDQIATKVREVADILELGPLLQRKPGQLSGGQRQRVAMGRAMVRTPDVFLFDEPLSNLDAKLRGHMRLELRKLHQQLKTTTLYVTHDQVEAMTLADRIVIMRDGKIEQIGTPRDIFRRPDSVFVATFIGSPPMNLIEMVADGDGLVADGIRFGLGGGALPQLTPGQKLLVGVRPNDITISNSKANATGTVQVVELLGASAILSVKVGSIDLVAEIDGDDPVQVGQTVEIAVNPTALHLFDAKTERRIN